MIVDKTKVGVQLNLRWEPDHKVLRSFGDFVGAGALVNVLWERDVDAESFVNPRHVWKTKSVIIQIKTLEELLPGLAVDYEVDLNGNLLHRVTGVTPHSFEFTIDPDDLLLGGNELVLRLPRYEPRPLYIYKEDRDTLLVTRNFQSKGIEWTLDGVQILENQSNVVLDAKTAGSNVTIGETGTEVSIVGAGTGVNTRVWADEGKNHGKWYWEVTFLSASTSPLIGVENGNTLQTFSGHANANQRMYYANNGRKYAAGNDAYGPSFGNVGDVIGVLLDLDNFTIEFTKNGERLGVAFEYLEELLRASSRGLVYPHIYMGSTGTANLEVNFGAKPFQYRTYGYAPYDTSPYRGALLEGQTKGIIKSATSQIVTQGRKTISSVAVSGSTDVVEEVLVSEPMRLIGENLYEAKIPKGKQLIIEVVE